MWYACLAISEQDTPFIGDMCIRCHVPRAWLSGRGFPTDGSRINRSDRDSINCHFCHRMVDPFYQEGVSPLEDKQILDQLGDRPVDFDSANYVTDPYDRRRGPRGEPNPHSMLLSPFHEDPALCETCHDVSSPLYDRQPDDTYILNEMGKPHPTGNKYDMFPLERASSEWKESEFARHGVDMGGRFGGNKRVVSTCQDCHMPDTTSRSASFGPMRDDMAAHGAVGGNTFTGKMIANLYPDEVDVDQLNKAMARAEDLLKRTVTLQVEQSGDTARVRVINEGGHKLPTGMPDGRRAWINVVFTNDDGEVIAECGAYDFETAELTQDDTVVYEIVLGVDGLVAGKVGLPPGPTYHVVLANAIHKDNRIPPRGFTNEGFRRVQSPVVGAGYSDGQYWDDALFVLPIDAARMTVRVYYQTASKEYIEFLRDENRTNDAGRILYEQWSRTGKSRPVEMAAETIPLAPFSHGDFNGDHRVDLEDYGRWAACLKGPGAGPVEPQCRPADLDADDDVDLADFGRFMVRFTDPQ